MNLHKILCFLGIHDFDNNYDFGCFTLNKNGEIIGDSYEHYKNYYCKCCNKTKEVIKQ